MKKIAPESAALPRVAESVLELIGHTPMLRLRRYSPPHGASIYAKLEFLNPGGSVKDRAALGMIEGAAELMAAVLRIVSGHLSDRTRRRKPFVVFGYAIASIGRPFLALATAYVLGTIVGPVPAVRPRADRRLVGAVIAGRNTCRCAYSIVSTGGHGHNLGQ